MILKGCKAICFGDRDGIPANAIEECVKFAGADVIFSVTECYVWTRAGAMDLENQRRIKKFAEQYGTENIVVVLGSYESEAAAIIAQTVTDGDPSLTGPLARVQLGLKVYHICENEIRQEVPAYVYDDEIGMMDMVIDVPDVCAKLSEIRNLYCKY